MRYQINNNIKTSLPALTLFASLLFLLSVIFPPVSHSDEAQEAKTLFLDASNTLEIAITHVNKSETLFKERFIGILKGNLGGPIQPKELMKVILAKKEHLLQMKSDFSQFYKKVETGHFAFEAMNEKSDTVFLTSIDSAWSIDMDEAKWTILLLCQEYTRRSKHLKKKLMDEKSPDKAFVLSEEKKITEDLKAKFIFFAKQFAKKRLVYIQQIQSWAEKHYPDGQPDLFVESQDVMFKFKSDDLDMFPMSYPLENFVNDNTLTFSGVVLKSETLNLSKTMEELSLEAVAQEQDWPEYPYWVKEKIQFIRGVEIFGPDLKPEKGHYWSSLLLDDMVKDYDLDHRFLLIFGSDILRSSGSILHRNPKLMYRSVFRGNFSDEYFQDKYYKIIRALDLRWSFKWKGKRNVDDIKDDEVILLSVKMKKGTKAGLKSFRFDSLQDKLPAVQWILPNSNNPASIRFVRNPRPDEFDDISEVFIHDRILLKLKANFPVDADEISVDICINGQPAKIIGQDDAVIKLHRVSGKQDQFTSTTLGLIKTNSKVSSNPQGLTYVKVEPGKLLTAYVHPYSPVTSRNSASAKIYVTPANVDALWLQALVDAAKAAKVDLNQHDITTSTGRFKLMDLDYIVTSPYRDIPIKLGDIAIMLLLKKNFINSMELIHKKMIRIRELSKNDPVYLHGFRETFRSIAKNPGSAFGSIPVVAHEGIGANLHVDFYNVYDEKYLQKRFGGIYSEQLKWQDKATANVLDTYIDAIKESWDQAKNTKNNDWTGLLELTGVHFKPVQDRILPNLLKLKEDKSNQILYWEPDKIARAYLFKVANLGQELMDNREVSEARRNVILAISSLTIAAPEIMVFRILSFAVNSAILFDAVTISVLDYLDRKKDAQFAFGAFEVLGFRRLEYAKKREVSGAILAVNIIGSLAGVAGDGMKLYELAKLRMTLKEAPKYIKILDQFADMEKLTEQQKEGIVFIIGEVKFMDHKLKQAKGQFFLTPAQQHARQVVHKIMPRLSRFEEIKFRSQFQNLHVPPKPPVKKYSFVQGGSFGRLSVGKPLGKGANAEVYSLLDYEDDALKILDEPDEAIARTMRTAQWLEDADIPHLKIKKAVPRYQSGEAYAYMIQERLPKGSHVYNYSKKEFFYTNFLGEKASKELPFGILEYGGYPLPKNKQRALMELFQKMAKKGLVWEDGHLGNIYFQRVGDKWQAGILDFDRITPMSEDFTKLLSNAEIQQFQNMQNSPGIFSSYYKNAIWSMSEATLPPNAHEALDIGMHVYPNPEFFMEKLMEYKWMIRYDRENKVWLDSVLEMDVVEEFFPDIRKHVDVVINEIN